jgi:hypothetical protein
MQRDKLEQLQAQIETGVAQLVGGQDWGSPSPPGSPSTASATSC